MMTIKQQFLPSNQYLTGSKFNSICIHHTLWEYKKSKYQENFKKVARNYIKISGIYMISVGKGFYIGSSKNIRDRLRQHLGDLKAGRNACVNLQRAFDKYKYLTVEVLETCNDNILIEREQMYVDTMQPRYNVLKIVTSRLGCKHSEETIQKLRTKSSDPERVKRFKEFNPGRFKSEETRKKLAEARKHQQIDPETQREGWKKFRKTEEYIRWLEATKLNAKRRSETTKLKKEKLRKDKLSSGTHKEQLRRCSNGEERLFLVKRSVEKEELVKEIKKLSSEGIRVKDIVKLLGVTKTFVVDIRRGRMDK